MNKNDIKELLFYIFITLIIGSIPSVFIIGNDMYKSIEKPPLSPPAIVFPIVWTILFIIMGISIYRIKKIDTSNKGIIIYFAQLIVNALWTPIFFGLNAYLFAFIWLLLLLSLVIIMVYHFYKIDKISAYINIPYIIWLLFAGYLNFGVFLYN